MASLAPARDLLRTGPRTRRFFVACAQSSLGTGLSLVALPLLALQRYGSSWAVAGVLVADFVPAMLLGALLGGLSDRWPRRTCVVVSDVLRCAALGGIALVHSLPLTLALAVAVGVGTALFRPAAFAGLPALAGEEFADAATGLFGAISTVGRTAGALLAGAVFALTSPSGALLIDAATFALSAALIATVPLGGARGGGPAQEEPLRLRRERPLLALTVATSGVALAAAMSNVAEPAFITRVLDAGSVAFALVVAVWGAGAGVGAMLGTSAFPLPVIRRRFRLGIVLVGVGFLGAGLSQNIVTALFAFACNGIGNGLVLVHQRALIRRMVAPEQLGRAFGAVDAMESWAFAVSLVAGGILVALVGSRTTIELAGAGVLLVALASLRMPVGERARAPERAPAEPAPAEAR